MEAKLPSLFYGEKVDYSVCKMPNLSTPTQEYQEGRICNKVDLLSHRNILLAHTLEKLRAAYDQATKSPSEESKALLKVRVERANQESVDLKGCTGREEDVRRTYVLLNELEEEIIRITAFINLHKVGAEGKGVPVNQAMPTPVRCAFNNCRSTSHFTNRCDKNLTAGRIMSDILNLCAESRVCPRCLRDQSYWDHNRTCSGSYLRRKDKKWIRTDCRSCALSLPCGATLNLNQRICYHAQREAHTKSSHPLSQDEDEGSQVNMRDGCQRIVEDNPEVAEL